MLLCIPVLICCRCGDTAVQPPYSHAKDQNRDKGHVMVLIFSSSNLGLNGGSHVNHVGYGKIMDFCHLGQARLREADGEG